MWLELVLKYRNLEFQGPQLQPILLSSQDSDKQKTDIKVTRRPAKGWQKATLLYRSVYDNKYLKIQQQSNIKNIPYCLPYPAGKTIMLHFSPSPKTTCPILYRLECRFVSCLSRQSSENVCEIINYHMDGGSTRVGYHIVSLQSWVENSQDNQVSVPFDIVVFVLEPCRNLDVSWIIKTN